MPPATWGLNPAFFIMGMVKEPVAATLAEGAPCIMPTKAEPMVATLAGPPEYFPARALAKSTNCLSTPVTRRKPTKIRKVTRYSEQTVRGTLKIPASGCMKMTSHIIFQLTG